MLTPTETYTLKSTFFETWHNTTQKLKRQELIQAKNDIRPLVRLTFGDTFDITAYLTQLDPEKQFALIKTKLLIGNNITRFFGIPGEEVAFYITQNMPAMLSQLTEGQHETLAKIDVERNGIQVLEQYTLSEELKNTLINTARKRVQAFLPPLAAEEWVIDCVKKGDLETLQHSIFNRFSGKYCYSYEVNQALQQALRAIHIDGTHLDACHNFLDILNRAKTEQEQFFLNNGCFQDANLPYTRPPHWGKHKSITEDTPVPFSHGGGFFHIIKFLRGGSHGYNLECPGIGIQVSPETHKHARDGMYAEKAKLHVDYPARLSGTIKAKYLDSAPNGYEAGLRANFIDFIEDIVITRLDTGKVYQIGTVDNLAAFPALDHKKNGLATSAEATHISSCTIC